MTQVKEREKAAKTDATAHTAGGLHRGCPENDDSEK